MKTVIIDNYDSFTYNLSHLVKEIGAEVTVLRNDQFQLDDLKAFDKIILSPGPGIPSEAGLLLDVIRQYAGVKPILGVCLGHQAIGEVFGARLENLSDVFHGVATPCHITAADPIFAGLDSDITVGRYHSWVVAADDFRLPRGDGCERRRAKGGRRDVGNGSDHGPAPSSVRRSRHTVPS